MKDIESRLLSFLTRLAQAKIHFKLAYNRDDGITVEIAVPGERWEVDFLVDGTIDVERFRSTGEVEDGAEAIEELFRTFSD